MGACAFPIVDKRVSMCYNHNMVTVHSHDVRNKLPPISDKMCFSGELEHREKFLNFQLENSPQALAQKIEVQLIKNAMRSPWLLRVVGENIAQ